jgi:hypothetical protein
MDYIHITPQKYTFSLKQQIFEADFLENRSDFSKNENANITNKRGLSGACSDSAERE